MEFQIPKSKAQENIGVAMRSAGYHKIEKDGQNSQLNFIKPLSRVGYPRFHIYLKECKSEYIVSLHLDQKRPVYKGAKAHSGEYEGEILEKETKRIQQSLINRI
ncbi:MAG: hypothetical protein PHW31_02310 [Candidatus Pacebacteria bacterium]|nr:hypothetical protein [Candidatus Paceibacterota bacterium]